MHSNNADCVFGDARLISSATTMFAKIGPARNSKREVCRSYTLTPVTSLGIRSGVNCTRLTVESTVLASALASTVLPVPGTSSISKCPSESTATMASLITSALPSSTWEIAPAIRPPTSATCASSVGLRSAVAAAEPGPSDRSSSTCCVTGDPPDGRHLHVRLSQSARGRRRRGSPILTGPRHRSVSALVRAGSSDHRRTARPGVVPTEPVLPHLGPGGHRPAFPTTPHQSPADRTKCVLSNRLSCGNTPHPEVLACAVSNQPAALGRGNAAGRDAAAQTHPPCPTDMTCENVATPAYQGWWWRLVAESGVLWRYLERRTPTWQDGMPRTMHRSVRQFRPGRRWGDAPGLLRHLHATHGRQGAGDVAGPIPQGVRRRRDVGPGTGPLSVRLHSGWVHRVRRCGDQRVHHR